MDSHLSSLPADILLEIVGSLSLQDAVALSMTCHRLWSLSQERAFWTKTFEATRFLRPLPCPLYEDFAKLDLPALKGLVRHAMRLEQNWSREKPKISAPIQAFPLGPSEVRNIKILFNIPGTPFIVTHTGNDGGSVTCWSRTLGNAVCSVATGGQIVHKSTIHEGPGSCSIAVRVASLQHLTDVLLVLRVQYGPGRETSMDVVFSRDFNLGPWIEVPFSLTMSLDSHIVAYMGPGTEMNILAFNMASGKAVTIETDLVDMDQIVEIQILHRRIYLHVRAEHHGFGYIHCCPTELLPYPDNLALPSKVEFRCHTEPEGDEDLPFFELGVFPSASGMLFALLVLNDLSDPDVEPTTTFNYYSMPKSVESSKTSVAEPTPVRSCTIEGEIRSGWLVATPWSSACFALEEDIVVDEKLKLVRFHSDTESVSVHSLEQMPPYIGSFNSLEMALDDHLGVVMVLSEGTLFSIPYA